MFVVMTVGASEAEVLGVKSQILAEGMTPYDHVGQERTVIAVVGEVGPRKDHLASRLAALPGVETVTPISRPFKLTSREFHPEDTVIRVLDAVIGDGSLTVMEALDTALPMAAPKDPVRTWWSATRVLLRHTEADKSSLAILSDAITAQGKTNMLQAKGIRP